MASEPTPKFLSRAFHRHFFPVVVAKRVKFQKSADPGTTFTSTTEMFIALAVCVMLILIGIPSAAGGSVAGWVLSILGIAGTVILVILSVASHRGERPTYDNFLIGIFFFFVTFGVFLGVPVGMERHSFRLGFLTSLAGLIVGYAVGIFAGLWFQRLGWIAIVINWIAGLGAVVLSGAMVVILFALVI